MATCSTATLLTQACDNNFVAAVQDVQVYRALKHQLLCNIQSGGTGGSLTPYTTTEVLAPAFPYSFTATERTYIEISVQLQSTGDNAILGIQKTGTTNRSVSFLGSGVLMELVSVLLGPGETLTLVDDTVGAGANVGIVSVVIYEG